MIRIWNFWSICLISCPSWTQGTPRGGHYRALNEINEATRVRVPYWVGSCIQRLYCLLLFISAPRRGVAFVYDWKGMCWNLSFLKTTSRITLRHVWTSGFGVGRRWSEGAIFMHKDDSDHGRRNGSRLKLHCAIFVRVSNRLSASPCLSVDASKRCVITCTCRKQLSLGRYCLGRNFISS
jgi:hypothetical protein